MTKAYKPTMADIKKMSEAMQDNVHVKEVLSPSQVRTAQIWLSNCQPGGVWEIRPALQSALVKDANEPAAVEDNDVAQRLRKFKVIAG